MDPVPKEKLIIVPADKLAAAVIKNLLSGVIRSLSKLEEKEEDTVHEVLSSKKSRKPINS